MDDGDWQLHSQQCAGTEAFDAQPGHTYTFRLTATDHVGNEAQTEAGAFTTAVTKYYYFGGKRVAMRGPDDAVVWLHGDHLGSTSLATDAVGEALSRQLYYPFGEQRWASAELPTDFQFTGQRNQSTIALYDYHARFYDPYVGRFIQADTIVPSPGNPQHFNRYSYVLNNPLKYSDPSGHEIWMGDGGGEAEYAKQFHRPWYYDASTEWSGGQVTQDAEAASASDLTSDVPVAAGMVRSGSLRRAPSLPKLAPSLPKVGSLGVGAAVTWVAVGSTVVVFTAIAVIGFSESTSELPVYEQPLPPGGGLDITTAINVTVMSEYGLMLTDQAATEIGGILHEMSRKQRGTGARAPQRPHQQQKLGKVYLPTVPKPVLGPPPPSPEQEPEPPIRPEDPISTLLFLLQMYDAWVSGGRP